MAAGHKNDVIKNDVPAGQNTLLCVLLLALIYFVQTTVVVVSASCHHYTLPRVFFTCDASSTFLSCLFDNFVPRIR